MKTVPYTRFSKVKAKAYIKTVPPQKIVKFTMGENSLFAAKKLKHKLSLVIDENVQIRDTAIEACRQYIHRKLDENFLGQYVFRVIPFPHHIQRENKMITGAGADRMQTGMQLSFGKAIERAALLRKNEPLFVAFLVSQKEVQFVRGLFKDIRSKFPGKKKVVYEEIK